MFVFVPRKPGINDYTEFLELGLLLVVFMIVSVGYLKMNKIRLGILLGLIFWIYRKLDR